MHVSNNSSIIIDHRRCLKDLVFPQHVGLPVESNPPKYYLLEVHYDNPALHGGIIDQSGFRLYYTPNLRTYDGGTLMVGSTVSPRVIIPPGREKYVVAGHSNPECLGPSMPKGGVKVLGALLHSHLLGRNLKARHFRNNIELKPLAEDNNYDFNYQDYRYYDKEVALLPDDQITVECVYDSRDRNSTTFGGTTTREEMCLVFLLYYPLIDKFGSVSVPSKKLISELLQMNITDDLHGIYVFKYLMDDYDWNQVNIDMIEQALRYSYHDTHCYIGTGVKNAIESKIAYPHDLQEYKIPVVCEEKHDEIFKEQMCSGCFKQQNKGLIISFIMLIIYALISYLFGVFFYDIPGLMTKPRMFNVQNVAERFS